MEETQERFRFELIGERLDKLEKWVQQCLEKCEEEFEELKQRIERLERGQN